MMRFGLIAAMFAASVMTVSAHHGFGTFDLSRSVTYTGKLTRVEFVNPHSWLYFEVTDAGGKVVKHRCELRSAHTLRRSGWSADLFKVGQQVTIDASPDRNDPNSCYLNTIKFADGTSMDRYGQYVRAGGAIKEVRGAVNPVDISKREARRRSGEPNITGDWAPEQVVMADPTGRGGGLVPLSQIGERPDPNAAATGRQGGQRQGGQRQGGAAAGGRRGGGAGAGATAPRTFGGTELTEQGAAAMAKITAADNPRFKCETTSIIFDWTFDGPVNRITQNRDTIVIDYGQMNLRRTIYMNRKTPPANAKPTRGGYSIGRWDGDTLVVETTNFLPGVLTGSVAHSDQLKVVERFTLDPKTMRLTREYEATDPLHFKGTYSGRDVVQVADFPYAPDNCVELKDVDYSKQQ